MHFFRMFAPFSDMEGMNPSLADEGAKAGAVLWQKSGGISQIVLGRGRIGVGAGGAIDGHFVIVKGREGPPCRHVGTPAESPEAHEDEIIAGRIFFPAFFNHIFVSRKGIINSLCHSLRISCTG